MESAQQDPDGFNGHDNHNDLDGHNSYNGYASYDSYATQFLKSWFCSKLFTKGDVRKVIQVDSVL